MAPKTSSSRFSSQQRVVLAGSEKAALSAATGEKPAGPSSILTVSVVVRRKNPLDTKRLGTDRLTRAQYRQQHGADPAAITLVRAFAKEFGLTVEKGTPKPGAPHHQAHRNCGCHAEGLWRHASRKRFWTATPIASEKAASIYPPSCRRR